MEPEVVFWLCCGQCHWGGPLEPQASDYTLAKISLGILSRTFLLYVFWVEPLFIWVYRTGLSIHVSYQIQLLKVKQWHVAMVCIECCFVRVCEMWLFNTQMPTFRRQCDLDFTPSWLFTCTFLDTDTKVDGANHLALSAMVWFHTLNA